MSRATALRACLIVIGVMLPGIAISANSVDICQEPAAQSGLTIAYYDQEAARFEGDPGETNLNQYAADVLFRSGEKWSFGVGYRGTFLNEKRIELQTNGYLHTFYFPLHQQTRSDRGGFRFSIAPALSASSNVASDPDEYTWDAAQLLAALVWSRPLSDRVDLYYGFCGDHRLGDYRVYPVINVSWPINSDWKIDVGFPSAQIRYRVSKDLDSAIRITPNGNAWYVKDKSLTNSSDVVYKAYVLEWELSWRAPQRVILTAVLGTEIDGRYEMTLLNGNRVRLSSESATRLGLGIAWAF